MRESQIIANKLRPFQQLPKLSAHRAYCLTHTYDCFPRKYYVQAPYDYDVLCAICAYIQYECADIDETFSMEQHHVIEALEKYYGCTRGGNEPAQELDLYIDWEWFCGTELQKAECLKREGMTELLQTFILQSRD